MRQPWEKEHIGTKQIFGHSQPKLTVSLRGLYQIDGNRTKIVAAIKLTDTYVYIYITFFEQMLSLTP